MLIAEKDASLDVDGVGGETDVFRFWDEVLKCFCEFGWVEVGEVGEFGGIEWEGDWEVEGVGGVEFGKETWVCEGCACEEGDEKGWGVHHKQMKVMVLSLREIG